uniref:Putative xaa-pro aminopeptidase p-like n=1 Tax=Tetraselmis sp. GSL018 TaxID=582737 RepID=A0A061QM88_9CHLO
MGKGVTCMLLQCTVSKAFAARVKLAKPTLPSQFSRPLLRRFTGAPLNTSFGSNRNTWYNYCGSRALEAKMSTTELTDRSGSVPTKDGEAKLAGLRSAMRECAHGLGTGVEAYIIPSEDAHMSEYAPECDNRRHFVSGFTGSAGTAVVTTAKAALWTDGRYFLQAEQELGEGWELMRSGVPGTPEISQFLAKEVSEGGFVGIDPFLHTTESARKLEAELKAAGRRLVPIYGGNLVDAVWAEARPPPPKAPLYVHPVELAGASAREKIESLQREVSAAGAEALLLTMLDEVAWALNLRGGDVDYNPVFVSYALLRNGAMTLYVDREKVTGEVEEHLRDNGVVLKPYEDIVDDLQALAGGGSKIMVDPAKVSYAIVQQIEAAWQQAQAGKKRKAPDSAEGCDPSKPPIVEGASPVAMAKAMKNEKEAAGMREAHRRDGIVLAKCFHRIEKHIAAGGSLTEVEVDEWITALRREQPGFKQPSFPTIAGEGPNGAVIHYRAAPNSCRTVSKSSMLLVDSGGQYDCGTTDVTRTMHFGEPSQHQVATFTAVLKGHIALATAVFPPGTPGIAIDAMARRPLWSMGLNYRHGTGQPPRDGTRRRRGAQRPRGPADHQHPVLQHDPPQGEHDRQQRARVL